MNDGVCIVCGKNLKYVDADSRQGGYCSEFCESKGTGKKPVRSSDSSLSKPSTRRRPKAITTLAWVLLVGGLFFLATKPFTWGEFTIERNLWNIFSKILGVAVGIGLLGMRKWSVILYFSLFVLNTVLLFAWQPNDLFVAHYSRPVPLILLFVVPSIVAMITLPHWKSMR